AACARPQAEKRLAGNAVNAAPWAAGTGNALLAPRPPFRRLREYGNAGAGRPSANTAVRGWGSDGTRCDTRGRGPQSKGTRHLARADRYAFLHCGAGSPSLPEDPLAAAEGLGWEMDS